MKNPNKEACHCKNVTYAKIKAAIDQGATTPEQVKAYRLADNKVAEASEWDPVLLNEELQELADMFDVDMSAFGFVDENTVAEALDLDEDQRKDKDKTTCHCPKCGFVFEV